jgi:hypothetical protein
MKRGIAALVATGLFLCFAIGTWAAVNELPGISDPWPRPRQGKWDLGGKTWFGHGVSAAYGSALLLLVAIYVGKRLITRLALTPSVGMAWYVLGVLGSLPYIWFLVVLDWQNVMVFRRSCWVYYPIAIWFVPTLSFAWDVTHRIPCSFDAYLLRTIIEIALLVPLWLMFWLFTAFFMLGGGWI